MSGYTKGPWTVDQFGDIEGPNGEPIATTDQVPDSEVDATNGRLIAAAPDMYEALKDVRVNCADLLPTHYLAVIDAALAKAEGR